MKETIEKISKLKSALNDRILGQSDFIDRLLVARLTNGHLLIEGVPGLAKTIACKTLAGLIECEFQRVQCTPDLLPGDIIGTEIFVPPQEFVVRKGPVFTDFLLVDEINRAPAKTQSALLEAMQERQVTIGLDSFPLHPDFLVLATQNPIEQEGIYPLPEAQLDRFLMKSVIGYPPVEDEKQFMQSESEPLMTQDSKSLVQTMPVLNREQLTKIVQDVKQVHVEESIKDYILSLVTKTRSRLMDRTGEYELLEWGAGPRASIAFYQSVKAMAIVRKRDYVQPQDVKDLAHDILRHRIKLSFSAEAEGVTPDQAIDHLLDQIKIP